LFGFFVKCLEDRSIASLAELAKNIENLFGLAG
jgi:hypothetical protein